MDLYRYLGGEPLEYGYLRDLRLSQGSILGNSYPGTLTVGHHGCPIHRLKPIALFIIPAFLVPMPFC
jgi:hypothetical protein